ncbi:bifunctional aminoglycoside phosphotransferase/ATP-binding protein [Synechococcus sp. CCY 9618]|uniref:bifunctional aminoglycoside phosphotransferase/ATP-binding protein n=1 Tax=Synechococcus sp. CCY 9618 TaxID=2815602 RepID=UPI001C226DBF|nr:bifunctional aminoglycoside phosphotransferase/ATP-binding protein [Synechococcus sp. CCY 9618]
MIAALLDPGAYDHPVDRIECLETHISWVLLTGTVAYKIKKPVNLGFVNFSTPERRLGFCREELRLNRRLAPDLYLGLSPVHGPAEQASMAGPGPVIDTAVRMRQFPQSALLPAVLNRDGLGHGQLEALADDLAAFHAAAAVAGENDPYGTPDAVQEPAAANLEVLEACGGSLTRELAPLRPWMDTEFQRLRSTFEQRRSQGRIRECHGDLHLGNMLLERDRIQVFDCLEFSPALRWIDVISDMAFLVMDLDHQGRADLGATVLNRWLGRCGDYAGLLTWRWYRVYRSLVRAKVCALRLGQQDPAAGPSGPMARELERYLRGAVATTSTTPAALVITHGVSGSGKSHRARQLCRRPGWIQLSSDVERKRLFGAWGQGDGPALRGDPYRPEVSEWLYADHLPAQAGRILQAGLSVVVDATFLLRRQRRRMQELACEQGVPFLLLDCPSSPGLAHRRITERQRQGHDPSDADGAVLESQLREMEPLGADERALCLSLVGDPSAVELIVRLEARLGLPGGAAGET